MLDEDACYRAVAARDRRFEGRFVTAVTTTGIYCRPGCPARLPARPNVKFYACAAAAEEAGFRPCMRCRPETSPSSPAWAGTSSTVARALRLIDEGALEREGAEDLAARLGLSGRWLRKLFREQLGATPAAVARTRRVHFARRLLDETPLPMEAVAQASGFGGSRRLHAAITQTFHRSPTQLRALRGGRAKRDDAPMELRVPARAPFDADAVLAFLAPRALPGVESVEDGAYRRSATVGGETGVIEVRPVAGEPALAVRWSGASPNGLLEITRRVRRLFDVDADVAEIGATLTRDPILARRWPTSGVRVPGAWDPFEIAVRAIIGQQVSVAAARTVAARLVGRHGRPLENLATGGLTHVFPTPADLAEADLRPMGLNARRAETIRALAAAVASGAVELAAPDGLDEFVRRLTALDGIGEWTAQCIALRALAEPDAFLAGDLGVRRALARRGAMPSIAEARARSERWKPWRAYAVIALWSHPPAGEAHARRR